MSTTDERFGGPAAPVRALPAAPYRPPSGRKWWARPGFWFRVGRCLVVWPAGFAAVVIATAFAAVVTLDLPVGGPLGWPLLFVLAGVAYSAAVGVPLVVLAGLRRWYLRLIPLVIVAAPLAWACAEIGVWAAPGAAVVVGSILFEAFAVHAIEKAFGWSRK